MARIIQDFIPTSLPTRPGISLDPEFITIHNTDNTNPGAGAAAHNRYVRGTDAVGRRVSWHYTVDDRVAYQHLPADEVGWHAGKSANTSSIGIEICMNADMDTTQGYNNAVALVAFCVKDLNLSFPACIKQHNDWTGKNCPRAIRAGQVIAWSTFLDRIQDSLNAASKKDFDIPVEILGVDTDGPEWDPENAEEILRSIDKAFAKHAFESATTDQ
ncbi:MAG: N-acetylmuramoyl-L-alanine amidase [Alteripontixanthobacter sp.]